MRLRDLNVVDVASGIFVLSLGIFVTWVASGYPLGTPRQLGPGAFPVALGAILAGLGVVILLMAVRSASQLPESRLRPFAAVLAGLLAFALTLEDFGLVPATASLIVLSSLAQDRVRFRTALTSVFVLSASGVLVFEYLLRMPLHAFVW